MPMTAEEFVEGVRKVFVDRSLAVELLSGQMPVLDEFQPYIEWYRELSETDKERIHDLVVYVEKLTLFRMLTVLDGVLPIIDHDEGDFELFHVDDDGSVLLTDKSEALLHDRLRDQIEL
jgi:hypothetical protein